MTVDVRFFDQAGRPWFIAKDIATALDYKDPQQAVRQHCKKAETCPVKYTGQVRHVKIIPQGDVNRLIMRSNKPEALEMQDWIAEDVLPALEQTGTYSLKAIALAPDQEARMLATYQNQIIKILKELKKVQRKEIQSALYEMLELNYRN